MRGHDSAPRAGAIYIVDRRDGVMEEVGNRTATPGITILGAPIPHVGHH